jgi:hypothetical protein
MAPAKHEIQNNHNGNIMELKEIQDKNYSSKNLLTYSWEHLNVSVTEKSDGLKLKDKFKRNKLPVKQILNDGNLIVFFTI